MVQSLKRVLSSWLKWRRFNSLESTPVSMIDGCLNMLERCSVIGDVPLHDVIDEMSPDFDYDLRSQLCARCGHIELVVRDISPEL